MPTSCHHSMALRDTKHNIAELPATRHGVLCASSAWLSTARLLASANLSSARGIHTGHKVPAAEREDKARTAAKTCQPCTSSMHQTHYMCAPLSAVTSLHPSSKLGLVSLCSFAASTRVSTQTTYSFMHALTGHSTAAAAAERTCCQGQAGLAALWCRHFKYTYTNSLCHAMLHGAQVVSCNQSALLSSGPSQLSIHACKMGNWHCLVTVAYADLPCYSRVSYWD